MKSNKRGALAQTARMLTFMRPHMVGYIPGVIVYSSQGFLSALISSFFLNWMTAAALATSGVGIVRAAAGYLGLMMVYLLITGLGTYLYVNSINKAERGLKSRLFRRFVRASLDGTQTHSGEGIAAFNTEAQQALNLCSNGISPVLSCVIAIVFSSVVVLAIDIRLGLVAIAIGLLSFFVQSRFSKPLGQIGEQRLEANADSVKAMSGVFAGALSIRAFGLQPRGIEDVERHSLRLQALWFRQAVIATWQSLFTTVQGWLTLVTVFALGGYLVAMGQLSFPALMMVPSMCQAITAGMSGIGGAWANMQAPAAASRRIFALLDSEPPQRAITQAPAAVTADRGLHIRNLSFTYHGAETPALREINLDIAEYQMVALVGESGSGKSTLLRILIGLYDREGLDLRLGAASFGACTLETWRCGFAYVDQSCKLFDMTVAENIALGVGKTPAQVPQSDIEAAARAAGAHDFITALPQGYNTPCGEKGGLLSGGQKQRIAIARALIRKAPVLVLDEAAAALDAESERQLMETVESLRGTCTILMTTHNLASATGADSIVVMDSGRVAEIGRHQALLDQGGLYARLYSRSNHA